MDSFRFKMSDHIFKDMIQLSDVDASGSNSDTNGSHEESRTELDSHANMPVAGNVIPDSGKIADVSLFSPDYKSIELKIVDAALQYECSDGRVVILVVRNALYAPSMSIPLFVMREVDLTVNDVPKNQVEEPNVDDHSIILPENDFKIPLLFLGVFSYFSISKPTTEVLNETEEIYMLSSSRFNPHADALMDHEGNMVEKRDRVRVVLDEIPEVQATMKAS